MRAFTHAYRQGATPFHYIICSTCISALHRHRGVFAIGLSIFLEPLALFRRSRQRCTHVSATWPPAVKRCECRRLRLMVAWWHRKSTSQYDRMWRLYHATIMLANHSHMFFPYYVHSKTLKDASAADISSEDANGRSRASAVTPIVAAM